MRSMFAGRFLFGLGRWRIVFFCGLCFCGAEMQADFQRPYSLTPPEPQRRVLPGVTEAFGDWTAALNAGGLTVDTTGAPEALVLAWARCDARFFFRALASGTVRFTYTISGIGAGGYFGWFAGPGLDNPLFLTTYLTASPETVSFEVKEGDYVGFSCRGGFDFPNRGVTIRDFSGPEVIPEIVFDQSSLGYRLGPGGSVTLSAAAHGRNVPAPISYQWEKNGLLISDATNTTWRAEAKPGPGKDIYRVLAKSGAVEAFSQPAEVLTLESSTAGLLLHLDFEEGENGPFTNTANGSPVLIEGTTRTQPGRSGRFAAEFLGQGFIRVPAANSDLELVATSYTIAWWIKPAAPWQTIFTLGEMDQNTTGYGARVLDSRIVAMHRNEQTQPLEAALTSEWQHVAIVFTGTTRTIYIDGMARNSAAVTSGIVGSGRDDLFIGAESNETASSPGLIDDFRIYNYALNSREIQALVDAALPLARVRISTSAAGITLAWPRSLGGQYRIEWTDTLGTGSMWLPTNGLVQTSGDEFQVSQTASRQVRFYRLHSL